MLRLLMAYSFWRRLDSHSAWSYFSLLSLGKHTPTPVSYSLPRASLSLNLCVSAERKTSSPQCPALHQRKHFHVTDHYFEMPTRFSNKNLEVGVRGQTMTEHCSLACGQCSLSLLIHIKMACPTVALLTVGLTLSYQSLIQKTPDRLAYGSIWRK